VLATVHVMTIRHVRLVRTRTQRVESVVVPEEKPRPDAGESRLKMYKKTHEHLYQLLQHLFVSIPSSMFLTRLSVDPAKDVTVAGYAESMQALNELLGAMSAVEYTVLTQLATEQEPTGGVKFKLSVAHRTPGTFSVNDAH
jgi:Tfp pilus assembly protein PilN